MEQNDGRSVFWTAERDMEAETIGLDVLMGNVQGRNPFENGGFLFVRLGRLCPCLGFNNGWSVR